MCRNIALSCISNTSQWHKARNEEIYNVVGIFIVEVVVVGIVVGNNKNYTNDDDDFFD